MKYLIALALIVAGLAIEPNGSQNAEIALGMCFFFGAINLVKPTLSTAHMVASILFPRKNHS